MSNADTATLDALLPDYEVGQEIGRGAMGIVHLGRHRHLDRLVAIKELPAALIDDPDVRARFLSEARTLASLDHPNIVPVYDFIDRDGHCLLVMEALQGGTLWDRFSRNGLSMPSSCAAAIATACGVEHAHANGVLHRDIKPENLLFATERQLKVTDFGIAKVISGDRTMGTIDGSVLGTPAYMAPEQAEGETLGPAADVYAIGAVLFELLSGQLPFEGDSPMTLLVQRIMHDAPDLRTLASTVPEPIADVVARSLVRDPGQRIPSAAAFASQLGAAATESWGEDWLDQAGIELPDATHTTSRRPTVERPGGAAETVAPRKAATDRPAEPTVAPQRRPPTSESIHPQRQHTPSPAPPIERGQLVDVAALIKKPPRRWPLNAAAAVAVLAAIALVLLTPFTLDPVPAAAPSPAINGTALDNDTTTSIDLSAPLALTDLGDAPVSVSLAYGGIDVWSSTGLLESEAEIDLGAIGYAVSGPLTLTLASDDAPDAVFGVRSTRRWYATAQAPLLLALLAVGLSMVEYRLRSFRDGSIRVFMLIGTALTSAGLAVIATALYAQYAEQWFRADDLVPVAVAGGVAGALVGLARANHAKARRRRTLSTRLQSTSRLGASS
ncbi:MAG: protein kinase [Acidimicrobiales bacterium]